MIPFVHRVSTGLVLAIGLLHTAGTPFFYERLSEASIWFAGAGLCLIFVGLLNIGLWPSEASVVSQRLAAAANFLFFFWLVAGVYAAPMLPQFIVGGVGAAMVLSAPLLRAGRKS